MDASFLQHAFTGGAWSKSMQGRIDRPDYRTAMAECLNAMPVEQGAWQRRTGFYHRGPTRGGAAGRLISFDFEQAAPYDFEFTDGHLRSWAGTQIATTNDDVTIAAISAANPAVVQTSAVVTWSTGDQAVFKLLAASCPLLQNRTFALTKIDTTHFSIADAITGATIDGSTLGAPAPGATIARVLDLASPYIAGSWSGIRLIPTDIPIAQGTTPGAVLLSAQFAPRVLQVATEPTATAFATFSLAAANLKDGPYFDAFTNGVQANPNVKIGVVTITLTFQVYDATAAYPVGAFVTSAAVNYESLVDQNVGNTPASSPSKWVAVSAGAAIGPNGFTGTDIGRMVRFLSAPPLWAAATAYTAGTTVAYGTPETYWTALASTTGNIPGNDATHWAPATNAFIWSWGKIVALSNQVAQATGTAFGSMTANGGLAASFDGINSKASAACSATLFTGSSGPTFSGHVGKNFTGGAQKIAAATIYPATDFGLWLAGGGGASLFTLTVNLRAKATVPASTSDGTLLGSQVFTNPNPINTTSPITLVSSDQATSWNYVWFEISVVFTGGFAISFQHFSSQVYFFNPPGTSTSTGVNVEILGDPLLYTSPIRTWRLGRFSDTTGWPTNGTFHEGRLLLAGVTDNHWDASKSNDPFNFAPTNPDGSVSDNNAISYTFNAPDVNPIFWMSPEQQGIVMGTQAGEWLVQATNAGLPLTPTTVQAHRNTKNGCANIEPRRTDHTLVVVQRFRRKILEYFPDVFSGKFSAQNILSKNEPLSKAYVAEIAYQQELVPTIWARMLDGSLAGVTYSRTSLVSSQEALAAPHRHALGSGRTVESITVGASSDGNLDALAVVTNDLSTGIRHVELKAREWEEGNAVTSAWFLDDAIAPSSTAITSAPSGGAPYGGITLNGLWAHNGKTVQVFAGGLDCGDPGERKAFTDFVVTNGSVFVPFGDSISAGSGAGLFTAAAAAAAAAAGTIVVGFTYTSDGQIVAPISPAESGARNGPALGKTSRIHRYAIQVYDAAGMSIGTDFGRLLPVPFKSLAGAGPALAAGALAQGTYRDDLKSDNEIGPKICWRITRPWPANIAALAGFVHTQDL